MKQYLDLIQEVLETGRHRPDRTGVGTTSIFDARIKFDLSKGKFPLLTTKFVSRINIFREFKAILNGELHLESLVDEGIKFWDPWRLQADVTRPYPLPNHDRIAWLRKNKPEEHEKWVREGMAIKDITVGHTWLDTAGVPRERDVVVNKAGELNAPYGPGWRNFSENPIGKKGVDQVAYVLDLLKNNPESRRILISAWNPLWMPVETEEVNCSNEEMWNWLEKNDPVAFSTLWNRLEEHGKTDNCEDFLAGHGVPRTKVVKVSPQDNIVKGNPCLLPCHWAVEFYSEEMTTQERLTWCSNAADPYFQDIWEDHMSDVYCEENLNEKKITPERKAEWLTEMGVPSRWLSLKWHQRSVDLLVGEPYNQGFYAFMLLAFAKETGMAAHTLVGDLTNVHIYNGHIDAAKLQLTRSPLETVECFINRESTEGKGIFDLEFEDFIFNKYNHHPAIKLSPAV